MSIFVCYLIWFFIFDITNSILESAISVIFFLLSFFLLIILKWFYKILFLYKVFFIIAFFLNYY